MDCMRNTDCSNLSQQPIKEMPSKARVLRGRSLSAPFPGGEDTYKLPFPHEGNLPDIPLRRPSFTPIEQRHMHAYRDKNKETIQKTAEMALSNNLAINHEAAAFERSKINNRSLQPPVRLRSSCPQPCMRTAHSLPQPSNNPQKAIRITHSLPQSKKHSLPLDLEQVKLRTARQLSSPNGSAGSSYRRASPDASTGFLSPSSNKVYHRKMEEIFWDGCEHIDTSHFIMLPDEKHKKHHKEFCDFLEAGWRKAHKPMISKAIIINDVRIFVSRELDFLYGKGLSLNQTINMESPLIKDWHTRIQNEGILTQKIFQRLKVMRSLVNSFFSAQETKAWSDFSMRVLLLLNHLVGRFESSKSSKNGSPKSKIFPAGREAAKLVVFYNEILHPEKSEAKIFMASIQHWLLTALTDNLAQAKEIIAYLNYCVEPYRGQSVSFFADLKEMSWSVSRDSFMMANISSIVHHWSLDRNICLDSPLENISSADIHRSWLPSGAKDIIFNLVTINNIPFWNREAEPSPKQPMEVRFKESIEILPKQVHPSGRQSPLRHMNALELECIKKTKLNNRDLFASLFARLSGRDTPNQQDVIAAICLIGAAYDSSCEKDVKSELVPWHSLLGLTTNTAWLCGDQYFRMLHPALFEGLYWTSYAPGIDLHINVNDGTGIVTQIKRMHVCLRLCPNDPNSTALGDVAVKLLVAWRLFATKKGWEGGLWIVGHEVILEEYWGDIRSKLTNTVDINSLPNKLTGIEYATYIPETAKYKGPNDKKKVKA